MEPLIGLGLGALVARGLGALGVSSLASWRRSLACGLALMFTMTGVAHFVGMRDDLVAMVPSALPNPGLLVTITGIMELVGVVGLLLPRTTGMAATGLTGLLLAIFPANVNAALNHIAEGGGEPMPLVPRTLMQLLFLAATFSVAWPWVVEQYRTRFFREPVKVTQPVR